MSASTLGSPVCERGENATGPPATSAWRRFRGRTEVPDIGAYEHHDDVISRAYFERHDPGCLVSRQPPGRSARISRNGVIPRRGGALGPRALLFGPGRCWNRLGRCSVERTFPTGQMAKPVDGDFGEAVLAWLATFVTSVSRKGAPGVWTPPLRCSGGRVSFVNCWVHCAMCRLSGWRLPHRRLPPSARMSPVPFRAVLSSCPHGRRCMPPIGSRADACPVRW